MSAKISKTNEVDTSYHFVMTLPNTSQRIRYLFSNGIEKKEIAKILNIRYQHVRNVILVPLKKN